MRYSAVDHFRARYQDFKQHVEREEKRLASASNHEKLSQQLTKIQDLFQPVEIFWKELQVDPSLFFDPLRRKIVYDALLQSIVVLDEVRYPGKDPNEGWVEYEQIFKELIEAKATPDSGNSVPLFVVDTQLFRLYFRPDRGGGLIEFDYKPRKINLCDVVSVSTDGVTDSTPISNRVVPDEPLLRPSIVEYLLPGNTLSTAVFPQPIPAEDLVTPQVTRKSKDFLGLRFLRTLAAGSSTSVATLVRLFSAKAGIGAHLANSTTGFSVEFWLEGENQFAVSDWWLVQEWNIALPSKQAELLGYRPLLCVGGVAEAYPDLSHARWHLSQEYPGGLYGLRLIDGLTNFVIDFRSSRQIHGMFLEPIVTTNGEEMTFQGLRFGFVYSAARCWGDDKSATVFLSIP